MSEELKTHSAEIWESNFKCQNDKRCYFDNFSVSET